MDNSEDFGSQFIESKIDIQDEMPIPKEEVVDIKADDSDLDIIEVHCNINPNQPKAIRKLPGKFKRKILQRNGKPLQASLDITEAIVISDSSDTECDPLVPKQSKNGCAKRRDKDSSFSSIILNCPKCNLTKTVYSTMLTNTCKECKVVMNFVCNECNYRYETLSALYRHKKMQCKKVLPAAAQFMYKCVKCCVKHKINKMNKSRNCLECKTPMVYECMICSKDIHSHPVIYRHLRNMCQSRCRQFFCNDCPYQCNTERKLLVHFSNFHPSLYNLNKACDTCNKVFANYLTLKHHKTMCGLPYVYCKLCPYRPRLQLSLQRHLMILHKIPKKEVLAIVKKSLCPTDRPEDAKVKKAAKEQPENFALNLPKDITCEHCNHVQEISNKLTECPKCSKPLIFKCPSCPTHFRTMPLMSRHAHRMHGQIKFNCNNCQRPFSYYGDYNDHEKWCGKEPRYVCKLCPFKTKYRHNFKGHMENLHDSNRPVFACQDCGTKYKTERAMQRHFEVGCFHTDK